MRTCAFFALLFAFGCGLTLDLDPPDPEFDGGLPDGAEGDAAEDGAVESGSDGGEDAPLLDGNTPDQRIEGGMGDGSVEVSFDVMEPDAGEPDVGSCPPEPGPFPFVRTGPGDGVSVSEPFAAPPMCEGVFFTPVENGGNEDADGETGEQCARDSMGRRINYGPDSCSQRAASCFARPPNNGTPMDTPCRVGGATTRDTNCDGILDPGQTCTLLGVTGGLFPTPRPGQCFSFVQNGACPEEIVTPTGVGEAYLLVGGPCPATRVRMIGAELCDDDLPLLQAPLRIRGEVMLERLRIVNPNDFAGPAIELEEDAHLILRDSEVNGRRGMAILARPRSRLTVVGSRLVSTGAAPTVEVQEGARANFNQNCGSETCGEDDTGAGVFHFEDQPSVHVREGGNLRGVRTFFLTKGRVEDIDAPTIRVTGGGEIDLVDSVVEREGVGSFAVVDLDGCERAAIADGRVFARTPPPGGRAGDVVGVRTRGCPLDVQTARRLNRPVRFADPIITGLLRDPGASSIGLECLSGGRCRVWNSVISGAGAREMINDVPDVLGMRCMGNNACDQIASSMIWGQRGFPTNLLESRVVRALEVGNLASVRIGRTEIYGGPMGGVTALQIPNGGSVDLHDSVVLAFRASVGDAAPTENGVAAQIGRTGTLNARHNLFAGYIGTAETPVGCIAVRAFGGGNAFLSNVFFTGPCANRTAFTSPSQQRFMITNLSDPNDSYRYDNMDLDQTSIEAEPTHWNPEFRSPISRFVNFPNVGSPPFGLEDGATRQDYLGVRREGPAPRIGPLE